jgi:hypothetical protein
VLRDPRVDFFLPEEIFPSPKTPSSLPDVLRDTRVDFFLPKKIFPSPQVTSSLPDVLRSPRVVFFLLEEIFPSPNQPLTSRTCCWTPEDPLLSGGDLFQLPGNLQPVDVMLKSPVFHVLMLGPFLMCAIFQCDD